MMSDLEASNLDLNNDDMPFSTTVTPATDDGDETFVSESMIKLSATVEQVMAEANRLEMRYCILMMRLLFTNLKQSEPNMYLKLADTVDIIMHIIIKDIMAYC